MSFKDTLKQDIEKVFFNNDEFAELHSIDRVQLNIVIDNDRLMHRSKVEYQGITVGEILYYAKEEDFEEEPRTNEPQVFDNIPMIIFDVRKDNGIYEIILKRNV